jgi:hypothetical protein
MGIGMEHRGGHFEEFYMPEIIRGISGRNN